MTPIFRFSLVYGMLLGLALLLVEAALYFIAPSMTYPEIVQIVVLLVLAYFFVRHYKESVEEGYLILGDAMRIGLMTGFAAGIIVGFVNFLYIKHIDSSVLEELNAIISKNNNLTDAEKADSIAALYSPMYHVAVQCFVWSIFAFVSFLIVGLFLKKEKTIFEDNKTED